MPRKIPSTSNRGRSPVALGQSGEDEAPLWPIASLSIAWMNMCMQLWGAWLAPWGVSGAAGQSGRAPENERRDSGLPWLPQFQSTVVPLHRRDDEAGAEAEKVSMRLQVPVLPWVGGSRSVIAIDTLMPRAAGARSGLTPRKH